MVNAIVDTLLPFPRYRSISKVPKTWIGLIHSLDGLTHIDLYMDDIITAVQGGTKQQCQVFGDTVRAFKWIFPYLLNEAKDLATTKKLLAGERY